MIIRKRDKCSRIPGFDQCLEQAMKQFGGGKVRVVKAPVFAGAAGGFVLAEDAPTTDWEKLPD